MALDSSHFKIPMFAKNVIYGNMAIVYSETQHYAKATTLFKKAMRIGTQLGATLSVATVRNDYGKMLLAQGQHTASPQQAQLYFKQAISELKNAIAVFKERHSQQLLQLGLNSLATAYQERGDYQKALSTFKAQAALKDSIATAQADKSLRIAELKNDFEQRQLAAQQNHAKEIAVQTTKIKVYKEIQFYFILGITLLFLLGILLWIQNHKRQQANKQLQQVNKTLKIANENKARFLGILNHDLRRPISNLIKFITLQQRQSSQLTAANKARLEQQLIDEAENLLGNMEDLLLWSKDQMQNFKPHFQELSVKDLFEDIAVFFAKSYQVKIDYETPDDLKIYSDKNYLKTIMRNLTANAVEANKENPNLHIIWQAYTEGANHILRIKDNGKGADKEAFKALYNTELTENTFTGLGLHLIRDLAKTIHCYIKIEVEKNQGAAIALNLKKRSA